MNDCGLDGKLAADTGAQYANTRDAFRFMTFTNDMLTKATA